MIAGELFVIKIFFYKVVKNIIYWWSSIDCAFCLNIAILAVIGILLIWTASTSIAIHLGLNYYFFVKRHMLILIFSFGILFTISCLPVYFIKNCGILFFIIFIVFLILTFFVGVDIKGSRRWFSLMVFLFQPSEFLKPSFIIFTAWLFSFSLTYNSCEFIYHRSSIICICFFLLCFVCVLLQPDLGQSILLIFVWMAQFFLAGLPWVWVYTGLMIFIATFSLAYLFLPHITKRVDIFFYIGLKDPFGNGYQMNQGLTSFVRGGFLGQGSGKGLIKCYLPDAHTDFIFSVAGEEFGFLLCFIIIVLVFFIFFKSLYYAFKSKDIFILLSIFGLSIQFTLQSLINISSTINLIPTKGITLPLVSYGGSSTLATSFSLGILLGLFRHINSEELIYYN